MRTNGLAGNTVEVVDASTLPSVALKGLTILCGITEFAEERKEVLVTDLATYRKYLGDLVVGNPFTTFCRLLIDSSIPFIVMPIHGYTNTSDKTTLRGVKATSVVDIASNSGTAATLEGTITGAGAEGDTIEVYVSEPNGNTVFLGKATVPNTPTVTNVSAALTAAIDARTATTGYSSASTAGALVISADAAKGATINGAIPIIVVNGAVTFSSDSSFAGGVSPNGTVELTLSAKAVGPAFNTATREIKAAASGKAAHYDLFIYFRGATYSVTDIPTAPDADELVRVNTVLSSTMFKVTLLNTVGVLALGAFSGGAENKALIGTSDYVGNKDEGTGIYAALNTNADAICVPEIYSELIDKELEYFVEFKKGIEGVVSVPNTYDADAALAYREGSLLAKIDSWRMAMTYGGLRVQHPTKRTSLIEVTELLQDIYSRYRGFNAVGPAVGIADPDYASWAIPQDVIKDVTQKATEEKGSLMVNRGINPWRKDATDGVVPFANETLQVDKTLLSKRNIANYFLSLERDLPALIAQARRRFKPNTPEAWFAIYGSVKTKMEADKTSKAIFEYEYEGDQFVTDVAKAVINTPDIINAGNYQFNLYIYPTSLLERVGALVTVTGSTAQIKQLVNKN
jgi:hypothetical protein